MDISGIIVIDYSCRGHHLFKKLAGQLHHLETVRSRNALHHLELLAQIGNVGRGVRGFVSWSRSDLLFF